MNKKSQVKSDQILIKLLKKIKFLKVGTNIACGKKWAKMTEICHFF